MNDLSLRLNTIYDMIEDNLVVCDLCSDHGLIPIKLINNNITDKVIATDIKQSSIDKINYNISLYLNDNDKNKIDLRLGDGLKIIAKDEFDILIISGIGCDLMIDILKEIDKYNYKYLLLSPQTKIDYFRNWLIENNLYIADEKIVYEDEQYYFIFKIIKNNYNIQQKYNETEILYSKYLLKIKDPTLYKYLNKQLITYKKIIDTIKNSNSNQIDTLMNYEHLYDITKNIIDKW